MSKPDVVVEDENAYKALKLFEPRKGILWQRAVL